MNDGCRVATGRVWHVQYTHRPCALSGMGRRMNVAEGGTEACPWTVKALRIRSSFLTGWSYRSTVGVRSEMEEATVALNGRHKSTAERRMYSDTITFISRLPRGWWIQRRWSGGRHSDRPIGQEKRNTISANQHPNDMLGLPRQYVVTVCRRVGSPRSVQRRAEVDTFRGSKTNLSRRLTAAAMS